MRSMKQYDDSFNRFAAALSLRNTYDPANINFDCLRNSIHFYEDKCGKFSDYGLMYIKNIAEACENHPYEFILRHLEC